MALPEKIHLEIVTPEKQLFSGAVDSVIIPCTTGYMGILPGHAPLLAQLGIGEISYSEGGRTEYLFCSGGFAEVLPDRVVLLTQVAEAAPEIDVKRADAAKSRAEAFLASKDPGVDFARAQLALLRAISRLSAVEHQGRLKHRSLSEVAPSPQK